MHAAYQLKYLHQVSSANANCINDIRSILIATEAYKYVMIMNNTYMYFLKLCEGNISMVSVIIVI